MKRCLFILTACMLLEVGALELTRGGKTEYKIVYASEYEKEAADELKLHLDQITGADFPIVKDKDAVKGPAIWLGNTAFTRKQGIDSAKLAPEEWVIRNFGNDLIIAGGKRHGTQNGVYDLLETQFGCRWFAWDTTVIPKNPDLTLKSVNIRKQPSFDSREIFDDYHSSWVLRPEGRTAKKKFRKRIGGSGDYGHQAYWPRHSKRYYDVHNFYYFLNPKKYFKAHPEYFSMNEEGKRFHGTLDAVMNGGNFCLTNPEVRNIVTAKMLETIAQDRKNLPESQWPDIYGLSPMDNDGRLCLCPKCAAVEKKERKMGLLLDFINDIARRVHKKYPDILIRTEAYSTWTEPPVSIRPEKNIVIKWCNMFGLNDCYRPITHPINAAQKAQFDSWKKTGANLFARVYWNMGGQFFNPPRVETMLDAIAPEIRYYHKNGVTMYFAEFQVPEGGNMQNFAPLQSYLGLKLLWDVSLDEKKLIADFMKAYFGPAEKPMTAFLNRLRKAVTEVKERMTSINPSRPYCKEGFMRECWKDLEQAYRLTAPGTIYRDHVEREMLSPMFVILQNTDWKIGNREKMIARYTSIRERLLKEYNTDFNPARDRQKQMREKLRSDLSCFIKLNLPVPEQFKNRKVKMLGWPQLKWHNGIGYPDQFVDDPDSVTGKAMITQKPGKGRNGASIHSLLKPGIGTMYSTAVGVVDRASKSLKSRDLKKGVAKDEKYHWYRVGVCRIFPGSFVWIYYWRCQCPLGSVWQPDDGMPGLNVWEVWVSLKFTGPAYVEGSKQPDRIWWDQVLLVKPETKENK